MSKKPAPRKKGQPKINRILLACCAALAVAAVVLLALPREEKYTYGEFTAPPFEDAAVSGTPQVPAELGWSRLQIRAGLEASVCGELKAENGRVALWFYNHETSDSWIKLRLLDEKGNILGETGLLRPGEYVQYLTLDTVPTKSCTVILKVMGYTPETYHSAGSLGLETTLQIAP